MNFGSDLLKRHNDNPAATLVLADGLAITGRLSVNDDNFNVDPDRGYDLQTNNDAGDGICALIAKLGDGETQEIPEGSPEVTLLFGDRVLIRGTLVERRDGNGEDGLVLLAGALVLCTVPPGVEIPSNLADGGKAFEPGCVCVVNASAVTSGLPEASADEGDDDDEAGEGEGGGTDDDETRASAPTGSAVNPD